MSCVRHSIWSIPLQLMLHLNFLILKLHSGEHRGLLHLPVMMNFAPAYGLTINFITPLLWQERWPKASWAMNSFSAGTVSTLRTKLQ
ncbi:hypothetical protein HA45_12085 [Pantoea rodasii]|nr:hypothetical protein HA45_12085 [Pantoea rodasii]